VISIANREMGSHICVTIIHTSKYLIAMREAMAPYKRGMELIQHGVELETRCGVDMRPDSSDAFSRYKE
jgi:hypothetical protein